MTSATPKTFIKSLCRTLCDVRVAQSESDLRQAEHGLDDALESFILRYLDTEILGDTNVQAALVSTGAPRLIDIALAETSTPLILDPQEWKRILRTTTPETVRPLFDRGLARGGVSIPMIGRIASGHPEWAPLLMEIAADPRFREHAILTRAHNGLRTRKSSADITAAYLSAQVQTHPDWYTSLAVNFLSKSDLHRVIILHLAGVPFSAVRKITSPPPVSRLFLEITKSAHGRLKVLEHWGSLSRLLRDPGGFETWRQTLAQEAGVVLPVP